MNDSFLRLRPLYGEEGLKKLSAANVAVFGLGGVGGFSVESLVRSGIGSITVVDGDCFEESNLNRQIYSNVGAIGHRKAEVTAKRIAEINPKVRVEARDCFVGKDNITEFDFSCYDVVIDAVDNITAKLLLIEQCRSVNTEIICCLGTAGKTDPTKLSFTTIEKTSGCPLARVMRRELKKREIYGVTALYSEEKTASYSDETTKQGSRPAPGSCIFVPSIAGIMLAHRAVELILNKRCEK